VRRHVHVLSRDRVDRPITEHSVKAKDSHTRLFTHAHSEHASKW